MSYIEIGFVLTQMFQCSTVSEEVELTFGEICLSGNSFHRFPGKD